MSDALSGVFLCSGFKARQSVSNEAYVKPVNIRIYSAPAPVRMRVVTYDVQFVEGPNQPSQPADWQDRSKVYQSPYNTERSFSFTIGTLEIGLEELFTRIRRHFYSVVLKGEDSRTRSNGFRRLMGMNTALRRYNLDEETILMVYNVHHVRVIDVDTNWTHTDVSATVRYQGNLLNSRGEPRYTMDYKGQFIETPHVYTDGRDLLGAAVEHFKIPEVQERVIEAIPVN